MIHYRVIATLFPLALVAVGCRSSDDMDHPGPTSPGYDNFTETGRARLALTDASTRVRSPDGAEIARGQSWLEIFPLAASQTTAYLKWHTRAYGAGTEMQLAEYRNEDDPAKAATLGGDFVFPPERSAYRVVVYGPTGAMKPLSAGNVAAVVSNGEIHGTLTTDEAPGNLEFSGPIEVWCSILKSDDTLQDDPTFSSDFCKTYACLAGDRPPVTSPTKTE